MNLLELAKGQIGQIVAQQAAAFLGEKPEAATKALDAILPALLGSNLQKASTPSGADMLFQLLGKPENNGGLLDNLSVLLGGGVETNNLINSGSGLLNTLLGDKLGGIANAVASFSGLRSSSASSLLSIAAPLLMNLLGKQVKTGGLDVAGLTTLLMSQRGILKASMPAGLGDIMGLGNMLDETTASVRQTGNQTQAAASSFSSLLPWIIAAAALLGVLFYWQSCNKTAHNVPVTEAIDTLTNKVDQTVAQASDMLNKLLPGGAKIDFAPNGIEGQLIAFIEDAARPVDKETWFNFDRLYFETGANTLSAESNPQLDNIAAVLAAYPKVKLKIGGYTDNTGSKEGNQKLSAARAENTMKALIARGVTADRLASEGYGDQHPVGDNATEEGRALNRRIAVRVTEK